MDLSFSAEERAFQSEVRAFLDAHLRLSDRRAQDLTPSVFCEPDVGVGFRKAIYERGWGAPAWPVEYGGTGWSPAQRYIFELECARASAPAYTPLGLKMVGPVIFNYGSQAQKDFYLPRILTGEDYWCPGLLRARLGSDLASLRTRASRRRRPLRYQWARKSGPRTPITPPHVRAGAHQRRREETGRHQLHPDRHEHARHFGAPDHHHRRRPRGQPGVLRQCARAWSRTSSARRARAGPTASSCSNSSAAPASLRRSCGEELNSTLDLIRDAPEEDRRELELRASRWRSTSRRWRRWS